MEVTAQPASGPDQATAQPESDQVSQMPQVTETNQHDLATDDTLDLAMIEADLDGVSAALERLDAGSYWTDEVTGEPIADELLAADPIARRAG